MSGIAREVEIARCLAERDRMLSTPEEEAAREAALRAAVLTLWQTSILRRKRLRAVDEINNGLLYYDTTFLSELPRLYAALEDMLRADDPAWDSVEYPRSSAWGAGSAATATAIRSSRRRFCARRCRMQSRRAIGAPP